MSKFTQMEDLHMLAGIFKKGSFPLFLIVGGVNTLFSYCVFAAFIMLGAHYVIASLMSLCLGVIFNFFTTGKIVFNNKNPRLFFKFACIYLFLYLLSVSLLKLNIDMIKNMYLNGLCVTIVVAFVAFFLNKYIVFKR